MSKLLEYAALIPKGLPNSINIIKAIINDVTLSSLPEETKEEIIRRRVICNGCPFNSRNAQTSEEYKELTGQHYFTKREDLHCSFCGCPMSTRTASLKNNCGAEVWNEENSENKIELKWKAR